MAENAVPCVFTVRFTTGKGETRCHIPGKHGDEASDLLRWIEECFDEGGMNDQITSFTVENPDGDAYVIA